MSEASDPDLAEMAADELARAQALPWSALSRIIPWGDDFEGFAPGGRAVTVERAYLWANGAPGDILCEVVVRRDAAGRDQGARAAAIIPRPAIR